MSCGGSCGCGPCYSQPMRSAWGAMVRPQSGVARQWGQLKDEFSGPGGAGQQVGFVAGVVTDLSGEDDEIDLVTTPPLGTTPGSVPVREANWDLEAQPFATYLIASGDTFVGLAKTYFGNGERWKEIWKTGDNQSKFPDPNWIASVGPLDMPEELRARMKLWIAKGKPGKPGDLKKSEVDKSLEPKTKYYVAAGVAALAAITIGVVVYNS